MPDFPRNTIRASELGQFSYCPHAWWLGSVEGRPSSNTAGLEAGTQTHRCHGRSASLAVALRRVALVLVALSLLALIAYIALRLMGG